MKVSRYVAEVGPLLLNQWLATTLNGEAIREECNGMLNALTDSLLEQEERVDVRGRAKFVTDLAVHLMHGQAGLMSNDDAVAAVATVELMLSSAEQICAQKAKTR